MCKDISGTNWICSRNKFTNVYLFIKEWSNKAQKPYTIWRNRISSNKHRDSNKHGLLICLNIFDAFYWHASRGSISTVLIISTTFLILSEKLLKGALSDLRQFLTTESPLKIIKKCFLIHLKSSFRSQDIWIFVLSFRSCRKKAWLER